MQQYDKEILHSMKQCSSIPITLTDKQFLNLDGCNETVKAMDEVLKKFNDQPIQFMSSDQLKTQRKEMAIAMADKSFTVVYNEFSENGNRRFQNFTGTLELEGSFANIRVWKNKELVAIHVIPANNIYEIVWINNSKVIKMNSDEHRA